MSSSSSFFSQSISDSDLSDPPSDIDDLELNFDSGVIKRTTKSPRRRSSTMPKNKGKGKKPAKRASDEVSPLDQEDEDTFLPNCLARLSIKKPRLDKDLSAIERLPNEVIHRIAELTDNDHDLTNLAQSSEQLARALLPQETPV
ncbi:hypothetical protein PV10_02409 [Exophiala mesophila]|uniref:Uncharacterized protein n=1 Tax=Exophiala mesophila TaxID=212818 RepID=A0A0D1WYV0_EXOME|nr:uncharacterized protein PV10_02409 [Exophiala mesophila]KIV94665.1 hypothetical protein PV10_02409 [Exophiala mesophila]